MAVDPQHIGIQMKQEELTEKTLLPMIYARIF